MYSSNIGQAYILEYKTSCDVRNDFIEDKGMKDIARALFGLRPKVASAAIGLKTTEHIRRFPFFKRFICSRDLRRRQHLKRRITND
jgi:hypothetical protein